MLPATLEAAEVHRLAHSDRFCSNMARYFITLFSQSDLEPPAFFDNVEAELS